MNELVQKVMLDNLRQLNMNTYRQRKINNNHALSIIILSVGWSFSSIYLTKWIAELQKKLAENEAKDRENEDKIAEILYEIEGLKQV